MALNRMYSQQRQPNRALWGATHNEALRTPPDSEYQSGDSIDSTMAEDSGESDSSSSDVAD